MPKRLERCLANCSDIDPLVEEHSLRVQRTARYHLVGDPATATELWVVVHGYGQLARYFLNHFSSLVPGRCILAPEALSRFYLDSAHDRVGATWMTREDRQHEIEDHVGYLDDLVDHLLQRMTNGVPVHTLGFSQGVATITRWATRGRTPLARMILWSGSLPPDLDLDVLSERVGNAMDLVLGDQDPYARIEDLHIIAQRLTAAGIPNRMHVFNGGHKLEALTLKRLFERSE